MTEWQKCLLENPYIIALTVGGVLLGALLLWEILYLRKMIKVEQAIYDANNPPEDEDE